VLRLYRTTDVTGAELGGALKNVIAIAAGAPSARGWAIRRGPRSSRAALPRCGGSPAARGAGRDADGAVGLGDLVLTCGSEKSRNFRYGMALARGAEIDPDITVEGVHTARRLAADPDLDTPLADTWRAMADGGSTLPAALDTLLSRPLKPE
jgi:glycerol-3-phosphate dehydrogenase (NAD(P)+)